MHSFHAAVDCTTGQSVFKPKNWNNLKQTIVIDLRVKYFLSHLDAVNDKNMYSFGSSEAEPYPEIHNIRTGRRSENSGGWGATLWALSDPPTPFGWNRINWSAKIWGANVPMPPLPFRRPWISALYVCSGCSKMKYRANKCIFFEDVCLPDVYDVHTI